CVVRILVVDDEEAVRGYVTGVLREAGYEAIGAASGNEAIEIAATNGPFDLLLTDVAMPVMDGPQLAKQIRTREPAIKVLYLTAYRERLVLAWPAVSDDAFLEKPVAIRPLLESVSLRLFGHTRGLRSST